MIAYALLSILVFNSCKSDDFLKSQKPTLDNLEDAIGKFDSIAYLDSLARIDSLATLDSLYRIDSIYQSNIEQIREYFNTFQNIAVPDSISTNILKSVTEDEARVMTIEDNTYFYIPKTQTYLYEQLGSTLEFPYIDELESAIPGMFVSAESVTNGGCEPIENSINTENPQHYS